MRARCCLFVTALASAVGVSVGPAASSAFACGSYWNIPAANGCQYYSASEGHTETQFCCSANETTHATFDTYSTILHIRTTAGGSWLGSDTLAYNAKDFWSNLGSSDKVGCYNHHTGTMFVNCHHGDGWET